MIRKGTEQDIPHIAAIYEHIHDNEECGKSTVGWIRGVYPTADTARAALDAGLIDEIIGEEQPGEPLNPNNIYNACGAVPDMDKLRAAYIAAQSQSQEPEPQPVSNLNTARKRAIAIAEAELRAVVV